MDGKAFEKTLVLSVRVLTAPDAAAQAAYESRQRPAGPRWRYSNRRARPMIGDDRRRNAEGDHVREAVVFLAEALSVRVMARHPAIERIEQHGHEHREAARSSCRRWSNNGVEPENRQPVVNRLGSR